MADEREHESWRRVRARTGVLMLVWLVAVVSVPWWAAELDRWQWAGVPLGYWCSSTGLLLGFVAITWLHIVLMEAAEAAARPLASAAEADGPGER